MNAAVYERQQGILFSQRLLVFLIVRRGQQVLAVPHLARPSELPDLVFASSLNCSAGRPLSSPEHPLST